MVEPLASNTLQQAIRQFLGSEDSILMVEELDGKDLSAKVVVSIAPSTQTKRRLAQLGYTQQHSFFAIEREGRPYLLLPIDSPHLFMAGLRIYTPCKTSAKILKVLISTLPWITTANKGRGRVLKPLVSTLPWIAGTIWLPDRLLIASKVAPPLEVLVTKVTGESSPAFAWLINSRAVSSKVNLQVMRPDGEILGYIKLSLNETASQAVKHEASVLSQLWSCPELRPSIPRVLYEGRWSCGYLMMLSALPGEPGPLAFTSLHEEFLRRLASLQPAKLPGSLLVKQTAERWKQSLPFVGSGCIEVGQSILQKAQQLVHGQSVPCGVVHGDFVPENTRVLDKRLLVFDWERAAVDTPIAWDIFHFHLELAYLSGKKVEEVFPIPKSPVDRACWLLYLLRSLCRLSKGEQTESRQARIRYRHDMLLQELSRQLN